MNSLPFSDYVVIRQFSVDDFESIKTSAWEGVRNYEARNLMKEMKVGDKVESVQIELYMAYYPFSCLFIIGLILSFKL
jgi:predicted RNA-binding protein with PUA-like domain